MRQSALILCLALTLSGCSILKKDDVPLCDGRDRRPANPNGSVLDAAPSPITPPAPDQLSAAPAVFASCA